MAINFSQKQSEQIQQSAEIQPLQSLSLTEKINDFLLKFSRVPTAEKLFFVKHLGIMLKAGMPLLASLQTLAKQSTNKKFIKILNETALNAEKGKSLTEALKINQEVFGELFINMVEAGELSGKLETVLEQIYIQMKKQHQLVSKVKGALTYPLVVLFAMGGIGIFMMIVVVPQLTGMLKDFNTQLPVATRILILVSDTLAQHGLVTLIVTIIILLIFYKILQTYKGKYLFQKMVLAIPMFSTIIKKINLAKFARTLSSLLKTEIMIVKSLQITSKVLGNLHYRLAIDDIAEKIKKGVAINEVLLNYPKLFPPIVTQMISIGEQTGELDNILQELAEFYEEEVDEVMETLPSVIEPLLILVLGSAVGAMAVAIIMPMYSITAGV